MQKKTTKFSNILLVLLAILFPIFFSFFISFKIGITWDEPSYILSGIKNFEWFTNLNSNSFSNANITALWKINIEHPPFAKIGFGLFYTLFGHNLGIIQAARIFNCFIFGIFTGITFISLTNLFSKKVAGISLILLLCLPRLIGYSYLATLDFPMAILCVLTTFAFFKGITDNKYLIITALCFACANLTKFNALFTITPLFIWGLIYYPKKVINSMVVITIITATLFILGWPWMYHNTKARLLNYLNNKSGHVLLSSQSKKTPHLKLISKPPSKVPVYYLGEQYKNNNYPAPWHYVPVLFFTTIPVTILLLFLSGIIKFLITKKNHPFETLILISFFCILLIYMIPIFPRYGGVRFFLQAYIFLAMIAASGLIFLISKIQKYFNINKYIILTIILTTLIPVFKSYFNNPSFYYNQITNGIKGASNIGLPFENVSSAFDENMIKYINKNIPENSKIALTPFGGILRQYYCKSNLIRKDLKIISNINEADYAVIPAHKNFFDDKLRKLFEDKKNTIYENSINGVTFCKIIKLTSTLILPY